MKQNFMSGSETSDKPITVDYEDCGGKGFAVKIAINRKKILTPEFKEICDTLIAHTYAEYMAAFSNQHNRVPKDMQDAEACYGAAEKEARFKILNTLAEAASAYLVEEVFCTKNKITLFDRALGILKKLSGGKG